MENYDEKMNYSFEPAPEEPSRPPLEQAKEEIRRSGKHTGLKIAALLAALAIVAAVGGSVLTKTIDAIGQKNLAEQESSASVGAMAEQSVEQEQPAAQTPQADASYRLERTPLPETLKSNEGDKTLTPAQVYKMNIGAVCGISTQVTADLWGVETTGICTGSGFVLTEDGYIVTNSHVIGDSNQYPVKVVFTGQDENEEDQEYPAQIVGYDKRTDIAVLKIDAAGLTPAEFADSDQLKVGDTVLSLGNPGVAGENFTNTLTKGMVSAVNRTVTMSSINMQYIQTDAAINPGSSGGALLNLYGQVVGINAAKITTTEIEGICFAIPTNIAKDVINDIVKNGYVSDRVRLGVTIRGLSSYEAEMYNVPQGLVIVGFSSDSEIPSKGAEIGDIITAINGVNTTSSNTLYNELEKFKAGEKVKLTIYRQASGSQRARTFEIEVTLLEDRGETQSAVTPTPEAP